MMRRKHFFDHRSAGWRGFYFYSLCESLRGKYISFRRYPSDYGSRGDFMLDYSMSALLTFFMKLLPFFLFSALCRRPNVQTVLYSQRVRVFAGDGPDTVVYKGIV